MRDKIIKILEEHTEWSENGQADLIWQSEYPHIAERIVKLFAIPDVIKSVCPTCGQPENTEGFSTCLDLFHTYGY